MTPRSHPRLWSALATALLGSTVAVAVGLGRGLKVGLLTEVVAVGWALALYLKGGDESDVGDALGDHPDERQRLVKLRARALTGIVTPLSLLAAWVVAAATKSTYWPFEVLTLLSAVVYFGGLALYAEHEAPARANKRQRGRLSS